MFLHYLSGGRMLSRAAQGAAVYKHFVAVYKVHCYKCENVRKEPRLVMCVCVCAVQEGVHREKNVQLSFAPCL